MAKSGPALAGSVATICGFLIGLSLGLSSATASAARPASSPAAIQVLMLRPRLGKGSRQRSSGIERGYLSPRRGQRQSPERGFGGGIAQPTIRRYDVNRIETH